MALILLQKFEIQKKMKKFWMSVRLGTKTILLAELMKNNGEILALDIHHKIKLNESNIKKTFGIDIIKAMTLDKEGQYAGVNLINLNS